jgi:hypothetical protein
MYVKKNILLVSSAFYPELSPRSFRATELAKEFYRQGHEVTVISKYRNHDYRDFLASFPIKLKMWGRNSFPAMPQYSRKPFSTLGRALSRFLMLLFEYPGIEEMIKVNKMLKSESEFDLMISFAVPYPVHWGVAWASSGKQRIAKTWIADCGDPYMFARLDSFKKPFYFKFLEVNFCRKCDCISIPFKEMQNQFYPQFVSKIKVIPQGFNLKEIVLCEEKPDNNRSVFIFAGSIIPGKRDLALFLDFLSSVSIDFLFIVYTNQKDWYRKYKEALGEKLLLNGYIDRLALLFEMSKADFLVNVDTVLDNQANIEAVPSKLIDYALSNRPILNISSSNLDKEMVLEFLNKNYSRQRVIDKSAYDITKVALKFLELINIKSQQF